VVLRTSAPFPINSSSVVSYFLTDFGDLIKTWKHGTEGEGSREESGTAATAGAVAAGLKASAHESKLKRQKSRQQSWKPMQLSASWGCSALWWKQSKQRAPAGRPCCLSLCQWLACWSARWIALNVVMALGAGCSLKALLQIARESWWLMRRKPLSGWKGGREWGMQPQQGLGGCAWRLCPPALLMCVWSSTWAHSAWGRACDSLWHRLSPCLLADPRRLVYIAVSAKWGQLSWSLKSLQLEPIQLIHMHPFFTLMAAAAGRLLNTHVTSCSSECDWALFGNISSKTKNFLAWSGPRSCLISAAIATAGHRGRWGGCSVPSIHSRWRGEGLRKRGCQWCAGSGLRLRPYNNCLHWAA